MSKANNRPRTKRRTRSDRLLQILAEYEDVVVLTHDNPDPDAIASGWGIVMLIQQKLKKTTRVMAGGAIVRAENQRLCELLDPPIVLVDDLVLDPRSAVVLVDCTPAATNHLCGHVVGQPVAVIDHHAAEGPAFSVRYRDIRPRAAASASIVGQYLRDQGISPGTKLATAMLYAFKSDTGPIPTGYSRTDQSIISWFSQFGDHSVLADIENAPLTNAYYNDLTLALQSTFVYEDAALCFLPSANGSEIVGEVADLIIRCRSLQRVLCVAVVGSDVLMSCRTTSQGGDATKLLLCTLHGLGHCGGHAHRAGGKIADSARKKHVAGDLQAELRTRWLSACNVMESRGTRLVSRKYILDNL